MYVSRVRCKRKGSIFGPVATCPQACIAVTAASCHYGQISLLRAEERRKPHTASKRPEGKHTSAWPLLRRLSFKPASTAACDVSPFALQHECRSVAGAECSTLPFCAAQSGVIVNGFAWDKICNICCLRSLLHPSADAVLAASAGSNSATR